MCSTKARERTEKEQAGPGNTESTGEASSGRRQQLGTERVAAQVGQRGLKVGFPKEYSYVTEVLTIMRGLFNNQRRVWVEIEVKT